VNILFVLFTISESFVTFDTDL